MLYISLNTNHCPHRTWLSDTLIHCFCSFFSYRDGITSKYENTNTNIRSRAIFIIEFCFFFGFCSHANLLQNLKSTIGIFQMFQILEHFVFKREDSENQRIR